MHALVQFPFVVKDTVKERVAKQTSMDVKSAFHASLASTKEFAIVEFSTWPALNEFQACRSGSYGREVLVKPDGFIRIHETDAGGDKFEHTFFLEVDRSSEVQDVLIARAGCYSDYYKSGGFAVRNKSSRMDFKNFPFRVLMVFKTAERRNNTAERLLQNNPPILTQVCLATFEDVVKNPLGAIWFRPIEYRDVVKGTPFEVGLSRKQDGYRRQTARELFIEKTIRKLKILTDETR